MPTYIRVKDLANAATTPATDDFILLSGAANGARKISRADFLTAVAGFYTADPSTYKLATLDAGNKVLVSQLPSSAFSYQGTWAASTNTPTLANGTGTAGDTYYASDSGSVNFGAGSISFLAGDAVVYDGSVWQKVPDVVNLLDGKGTLDEAKTTLEIPDVGTAPGETPLNQHLGSLAYQSADSVSVDTLEVTDKVDGSLGIDVTPTASKLEISGTTNSSMMLTRTSSGIVSNLEDASGYGALALYQAGGGVKAYVTGNGNSYFNGGNVGIGGSPSYDLHVTNASTAASIGITGTGGSKDTWTVTSSDGGGKALLNFKDEDTANTVMSLHQDSLVGIGTDSPDFTLDVAGDIGVDYKIYHNGDHDTFLAFTGDTFTVRTGGADRLTINNSAIQMGTGMGIDFGSGASTTLDAYEEGTFTGTFRDATSGGNASSTTFPGVYTRIGDVVYFRVGCGNISTSGMTAGNVIYLHGLPFQASASKSGPVNAVQTDTVTTGDYLTVAANAGTSYCDFRKNTSGAGDAQLLVSDLTSGTSDMTVSGLYYV